MGRKYLDHLNHAFEIHWEDLEIELRWTTLKSPLLHGAFPSKKEYSQEVGAIAAAIIR